EIALDDLAGVVEQLQNERPLCARAIKNALEDGDYVCQGQQVLQASARYSVKTDVRASGSTTGEDAGEMIKARIDPQARQTGGTTISGSNCYYGGRVTPRCLPLPGHGEWSLPVRWFEWQWERLGWRP